VHAVVNMSQISARREAKSNAARHHWLAERLDVAFRLERDEWQGRTTLQARVASMAPSQ